MNKKEKMMRLPEWLKVKYSSGGSFNKVNDLLGELKLSTVCESACCPNRSECFGCGTATFMIMGEVCSRNCRFCAVSHGKLSELDEGEPERLARAVAILELRHVVITSVTRDDLPDGGAGHFSRCISEIRKQSSGTTIEVLTPDFMLNYQSLDIVADAGPDVFNHNIETTRSLTPQVRSNADYDRSLAVLSYMSGKKRDWKIKSGFMVGLGENFDDLVGLMRDLRLAGVDMLTIGQYLQPSKDNIAVARYYHPDEFVRLKNAGQEIGFSHVAAGPFVRSSYHAELSLRKAEND